jgi:hypothetical protein
MADWKQQYFNAMGLTAPIADPADELPAPTQNIFDLTVQQPESAFDQQPEMPVEQQPWTAVQSPIEMQQQPQPQPLPQQQPLPPGEELMTHEGDSAAWRGLAGGTWGMAAVPPAVGSMLAKMVGADETAQKLAGVAQPFIEKAQEYAPNVTFQQMIEDPSLENILYQIQYQAGSLAPSMLTGLGGAAVGGAVARKIASKNILNNVIKRRAGKLAEKAAYKELTEAQLMQVAAQRLGQQAGIIGTTAPMESGHMFMGDVERRGIEEADPWSAAALGTAAGMVETAFGGGALRAVEKILGPKAARKAMTELAKGSTKIPLETVKEAIVQGGQEALQEFTQEGLAVLNDLWTMPEGQQISGSDVAWRLGEAAFAGLVGGAGTGGVTGATSDIRTRVQQLEGMTDAQKVRKDAQQIPPQGDDGRRGEAQSGEDIQQPPQSRPEAGDRQVQEKERVDNAVRELIGLGVDVTDAVESTQGHISITFDGEISNDQLKQVAENYNYGITTTEIDGETKKTISLRPLTPEQRVEKAARAATGQAEPVEKADFLPPRPVNDRWESDRGAAPGDPIMVLDDGKAAIIEYVDDLNNVTYDAMLPGGETVGNFATVEEAAKAAEREVDRREQPEDYVRVYPKGVEPEIKTPEPPKPSKVRTLRGAIKKLGGINFLNYKGELSELPTAVKYLSKKDGTPIDNAVDQLQEEGWLAEDEGVAEFLELLRNPESLKRRQVLREGVEVPDAELTDTERRRKKEMEWEPEEPPEGEYVQVTAEDLPEGTTMTIIDGNSIDGWDTYTVVEKDPFGITLKDGTTIELKPLDKVEVLIEDKPALKELRAKARSKQLHEDVLEDLEKEPPIKITADNLALVEEAKELGIIQWYNRKDGNIQLPEGYTLESIKQSVATGRKLKAKEDERKAKAKAGETVTEAQDNLFGEPTGQIQTGMFTPGFKPKTKRERALADYYEFVRGLTDEQRKNVADMIEDSPDSPATLKFKIQQALEKTKPGEDLGHKMRLGPRSAMTTLVDSFRDASNIEHELREGDDGRWYTRVYDADADRNIDITSYPTREAAEKKLAEFKREAEKPEPKKLWELGSEKLKEELGAERVVIDNPGGDWLRHEQQLSANNKGGSRTGTIYTVMVPIEVLETLPGRMGEHERIGADDARVNKLAESMRKEGLKNPPFINVEYDGSANVNEGNHRIRAAKKIGLTEIPVEVAYYAGGERADGPFSLENLKKYQTQLKRAEPKEIWQMTQEEYKAHRKERHNKLHKKGRYPQPYSEKTDWENNDSVSHWNAVGKALKEDKPVPDAVRVEYLRRKELPDRTGLWADEKENQYDPSARRDDLNLRALEVIAEFEKRVKALGSSANDTAYERDLRDHLGRLTGTRVRYMNSLTAKARGYKRHDEQRLENARADLEKVLKIKPDDQQFMPPVTEGETGTDFEHPTAAAAEGQRRKVTHYQEKDGIWSGLVANYTNDRPSYWIAKYMDRNVEFGTGSTREQAIAEAKKWREESERTDLEHRTKAYTKDELNALRLKQVRSIAKVRKIEGWAGRQKKTLIDAILKDVADKQQKYEIGDYVTPREDSGIGISNAGRVQHIKTDYETGEQMLKTNNTGNLYFYGRDWMPAKRPAKKAPTGKESPIQKIATKIKNFISTRDEITWTKLFAAANRAFGGTQAEGAYTPKDAYDAMELGLNQWIEAQGQKYDPSPSLPLYENERAFVTKAVALLDMVAKRLPTQSKRTKEQQEFQQFSTPPPFAYVANWAANIGKDDIYLEPSAGVGGLAIFGRIAKAKEVHVNELSERRADLLRLLGFENVYTENAEYLNSILPQSVKPTVIVMNRRFRQQPAG